MELTDTHCHIHEAAGTSLATELRERYAKAGVNDADDIIRLSLADDVTRMICVGTTLEDSELAVDFVQKREHVWASIGLHPHEAKLYIGDEEKLARFAALAKHPKVVAVGECGLDYFYNHSPKADQEKILRFQIELALEHDLPMIFHIRSGPCKARSSSSQISPATNPLSSLGVPTGTPPSEKEVLAQGDLPRDQAILHETDRDAFDDFWPIFDDYEGVRGVIHSFTGDTTELARILSRGLYVGQNGIVTFTKKQAELDAAKAIPDDRLLLETDAPFLTPKPHRGTICMPKHVRLTAEFLADLRGESLTELAEKTTRNARALFVLKD